MFVNHPLIRQNSIEEREYQKNLADDFLKKGNSLIVAPTALGKTIIAAQIIAEILEKNKDEKILFLAPTKPLAVQHINTLREIMNLEESDFTVLTGQVSPEQRKPLWKSKVIAATPQTIENDIINGYADLKNVGLVIFDEAHRAVQGYAYVFIAEQYKKRKENGRILALTASPGSTRQKIQEICNNLFISNVEIKSESDKDVEPYVHRKNIEWKQIELPEEFKKVKENLEAFITEKMNYLKEAGIISSFNLKMVTKKQLLGIQHSLFKQENKTAETYQAIAVNAMIIKASYALELLETQNVHSAVKYFKKIARESKKTKSSRSMLENIRIQRAIVELNNLDEKKIEHPKTKALVETVKEEISKGNKVIVFTHYRDMAEFLQKKLEKEGINGKKFIGQSSKGLEKGLTQKQQIEMIQSFKDKEFDVLLCTSVGEEGLDIPSVDTVIFYEPVSSAIRHIQRKGRTGRHHEGKVIILMTKNTRDEAYYWSSVNKEKKMKLIMKDISKNGMQTQKTISSFVEKNEEDKPVIYVDSRERSSGIVRNLLNKDAVIKSKNLEVADFVVSERVAVERKEGGDFIQSMIDGRLFTQLKDLASSFEKPILIIEGNVFGVRNVSDSAIRGAISSVAVDYRIPIIQTRDTADTAEFIYFLAKKEQFGEKKEIKLRGEKHSMSMEDQQQFIIESLPGIGPSSAKQLLKHFRSVEKVFNAEEKQLKEVEGIGEKRAKEIRETITKEYEN